MELDVDRLRVLVEVVHAGSIAEAARRLAFTPSALSQQIAKLERECRTQLLDRRPGGVTPTAVGAILVRHGERVLGELREAYAAVTAAAGDPPQRLALGTFSTAGQVLVPAALAALERLHPRAELSLLDIEPPDGYGLVTAGDLDLLITHRYPGVAATPHPGLDRRPLLHDPLLLVLPDGHRHADRPFTAGIGLDELAADRWISGAPGIPNRVCLQTLARDAGLELHVSAETADYHVTLALVAAGLGVALVPASLLADPARGLRVHRLRDAAPAREVCLVHRRQPSPLVREFVTLLRDAAEHAVAPRYQRP
jgi:DNA-binding transcriptional LysR family regulator